MEGERRRPITSERATLDPFEALAGDVRPREQRDLMERPFFSLAKAQRVRSILYQTGDTQVQVYAVPEHGMATIWDADVLILAASQILTAQDRGLPTSRFFQFTPYQLLIAVGRATGNRNTSSSRVRSSACRRPSSASPSVTASTGVASSSPGSMNGRSSPRVWAAARAWSSCCPNGYTEAFATAGSCSPSIPPPSRSRAASHSGSTASRKHAGHQREEWRFELGHLHAKSASLVRFSDFVLHIPTHRRASAVAGLCVCA
jgi:plasmid replication initiation protein